MLKSMMGDLVSLFYPDICAACEEHLHKGEHMICTACRYHLPQTDFHLFRENELEKHFWGKIKIEAASAHYFFNKGEKVQNLIHNLKYKKQEEVGFTSGRLYGSVLKDAHPFSTVSLLVPVPLHKKKLLKRGFNQSECIASGMSESMGVPQAGDFLQRVSFTETQTRKSRFQRWSNVKDLFRVNPIIDQNAFSDIHFLLIDDVVTTGSTLEASAKALLEIPGARVSIAAIAFASR